MKEFEKVLRDLPKPDVPVDEFRRSLRGELTRSLRMRSANRYRRAFRWTTAAAVGMAVVLVAFVGRPDLPARLHGWIGGEASAVVHPSGATAEVDRTMIANWYEQQALPVQVGEMEQERIYAVRQYQLTNGERIVVFTELGQETRRPSLDF